MHTTTKEATTLQRTRVMVTESAICLEATRKAQRLFGPWVQPCDGERAENPNIDKIPSPESPLAYTRAYLSKPDGRRKRWIVMPLVCWGSPDEIDVVIDDEDDGWFAGQQPYQQMALWQTQDAGRMSQNAAEQAMRSADFASDLAMRTAQQAVDISIRM